MKPKFSISPYSIISYVFYGTAVFLCFFYYRPVQLESHPALAWHLLRANPYAFVVPASGLGPARSLLPGKGAVSLITDEPFGKEPKWTRFLHDAENFLCPVVINKKPEEKIAVVFCSTPEIAEKRLKETGYAWQTRVSAASGTAVKIS